MNHHSLDPNPADILCMLVKLGTRATTGIKTCCHCDYHYMTLVCNPSNIPTVRVGQPSSPFLLLLLSSPLLFSPDPSSPPHSI